MWLYWVAFMYCFYCNGWNALYVSMFCIPPKSNLKNQSNLYPPAAATHALLFCSSRDCGMALSRIQLKKIQRSSRSFATRFSKYRRCLFYAFWCEMEQQRPDLAVRFFEPIGSGNEPEKNSAFFLGRSTKSRLNPRRSRAIIKTINLLYIQACFTTLLRFS